MWGECYKLLGSPGHQAPDESHCLRCAKPAAPWPPGCFVDMGIRLQGYLFNLFQEMEKFCLFQLVKCFHVAIENSFVIELLLEARRNCAWRISGNGTLFLFQLVKCLHVFRPQVAAYIFKLWIYCFRGQEIYALWGFKFHTVVIKPYYGNCLFLNISQNCIFEWNAVCGEFPLVFQYCFTHRISSLTIAYETCALCKSRLKGIPVVFWTVLSRFNVKQMVKFHSQPPWVDYGEFRAFKQIIHTGILRFVI